MPLGTEIIQPVFVPFVPMNRSRNRLPPDGQYARALARAFNHLIGRSPIIIPGKEVPASSARNTVSDLALWRTRYRASPNGTTLVSEVHLLPTENAGHAPDGTPKWYLKVDGAAKADQTHNRRCAAGAGTALNDRFIMRQEVTVTAGVKHTVDLWTKDRCRVVGWFLYEKPRDSLVVGADTLADYTRLLPLSPILDVDLDSLYDAATAVWEKVRAHHMSFHVDDPASPIQPTTTATNPWDGSTARTANTVGSVAPTQYRNSYANQLLATPTIATVCWAYGRRTSVGGSLTVRFIGENGSADVTINGAEGIYETTSFTLKPQAAGDKFDVHVLKDVGGTTGDIYGFGTFGLVGS